MGHEFRNIYMQARENNISNYNYLKLFLTNNIPTSRGRNLPASKLFLSVLEIYQKQPFARTVHKTLFLYWNFSTTFLPHKYPSPLYTYKLRYIIINILRSTRRNFFFFFLLTKLIEKWA